MNIVNGKKSHEPNKVTVDHMVPGKVYRAAMGFVGGAPTLYLCGDDRRLVSLLVGNSLTYAQARSVVAGWVEVDAEVVYNGDI